LEDDVSIKSCITRSSRIGYFLFLPAHIRLRVAMALGVLAFAAAAIVRFSGGAQYATLQVMYLPIILAGLMCGLRWGVVTAIVGGLLVGPMMPLDVLTGQAQEPVNWLFRILVFCVVGGTVGGGADTLRRQLKELYWLTEHDAESGMLGRSGLLKALKQIVADGTMGRELSVVVVNMNNYLEIQNTFGLDFSEKLLKSISERWTRAVPPKMPIAMIQPDRLSVVFPDTAEAQSLRADIEKAMRAPYLIDEVPVYVDFAIGAARYPSHAKDAEELLQKAGIAMHTAVTRGQPFVLYDIANDRTSRENLILIGSLPAAIANKELTVWHQAKFSVADGRVEGTEALLRWAHPQRGYVPPASFISRAEETALIDSIGQCVIRCALADLASLAAQGKNMSVAINMSARNFHDLTLLEFLHDTVLGHRIDPGRVEVEITESAVMNDFENCKRLVAWMRDRGYRVAIDDFGTGHASLSYLRRLPVTTLKIDQSFVKHMVTDEDDRKIVRTIVELTKAFGLQTVAEGIEDSAALPLLREWGCDYAQGFALHRPAPFPNLVNWMEGKDAPPVLAAEAD